MSYVDTLTAHGSSFVLRADRCYTLVNEARPRAARRRDDQKGSGRTIPPHQ